MRTPVSTSMLNTTAITHWYAIAEAHGGRAAEIRLIGDFRASGVNDVLATHDANIPENLEVFLPIAEYLNAIAPDNDIRPLPLDFAHAYKRAASGVAA